MHDNYRNNPFHNFRHCFCVTQMMYSMVWLCGLQVGPASPHPPSLTLLSGCTSTPPAQGAYDPCRDGVLPSLQPSLSPPLLPSHEEDRHLTLT